MAKKQAGPQYPMVIETFRDVGRYEIGQLKSAEPSCFNGYVRVTKYRVTVEVVDEPLEVVHERLRKLWRECDNMHHYHPLKNAAARFGLELDPNELGKDRER
jgi:hypothetical protein